MSQARQYEMKDSGVEWIGEMPSSWQVQKAKLFIKITNGSDPLTEGETPVYGSGSNSFRTCGEYKEGPAVLVGRKGSIDKPRFVTSRYWNVDTAFDVKTTNDFNLRLYYYLATCFDYKFYMSQTTLPSMTQTNYRNMPLPVPSSVEQAAIVAYLDDKCSAIDGITAEAKATIEEYKKWKASVIFEAVTKGLNPYAEMKDSGVDIIGKMPARWSLIRQRFLCKTTTGDHDTQDADPDGEYPFYVRSPNVERSNTYTFEGEAILMAGDGVGAGKVFHYATGKLAIHQRVYCFYDFRNIQPRFFYFYMSNLFATEIDKGSAKSTVASVRLPMLKDFPICIPSMDEQLAILSYLDDKCSNIDSVIAEKEALIDELETYKKSLIFETVTGKRRVC